MSRIVVCGLDEYKARAVGRPGRFGWLSVGSVGLGWGAAARGHRTIESRLTDPPHTHPPLPIHKINHTGPRRPPHPPHPALVDLEMAWEWAGAGQGKKKREAVGLADADERRPRGWGSGQWAGGLLYSRKWMEMYMNSVCKRTPVNPKKGSEIELWT